MRSRLMIPLALGLPLCGCQAMQYAMDNYKGVKVQTYLHLPNDGKPRFETVAEGSMGQTRTIDRAVKYRIFDKPDENRLMITSSLGAAAGMGFAKGITLGVADVGTSPAVMREAAAGYLASTGRTCTTDQIDLIGEPQYEVRYSCQTGAIAGATPAKTPTPSP